jgi:hypothetical protein
MRTYVTGRGRRPVTSGGSAPAGRAATVAVVLFLVVLAPAATVGADPSPADASSTTTVPVTTTVPSTTTTTVPITTTTVAPTTTTSTSTTAVPRTTTSSSSTTTSTVPRATTTSSSTPWGLIALIVVLVVAVVVVALLLRSRKKKATEAQWRRVVVPALSDAQLARESLLSGNALSADAELRGAVSVQAERAAVALDHAANAAPDPQAGSTASGAAGALRGLAFAIEADRLLRQGSSAPTGMQLAQADEARRARQAELNTALARLSARIGSGAHTAT